MKVNFDWRMASAGRPINLQRFAEENGEGGENPAAGEGGDPEVFEWTDPKTKETHRLPARTLDGKDLSSLLNRASEAGRIAATTKEKQRYRELEKMLTSKDVTLEELQEKINQMEEEKMTAEERASAKFTRELERANKLAMESKAAADHNFNLFMENKITNDLYSAFAGHELSNIDQAMLILRSQGNATLIEAEGKYSTVLTLTVNGETVELSPKEAVERWVAMPENAHFIRNNLRPGSGTTSTAGAGVSANGTLQYKRSMMSDSKVRAEYMEKQRRGEAVSLVDDL